MKFDYKKLKEVSILCTELCSLIPTQSDTHNADNNDIYNKTQRLEILVNELDLLNGTISCEKLFQIKVSNKKEKYFYNAEGISNYLMNINDGQWGSSEYCYVDLIKDLDSMKEGQEKTIVESIGCSNRLTSFKIKRVF